MSRRLMLRNASGGGGILPPEYQQVEWIGKDSGAAYLWLNNIALKDGDALLFTLKTTGGTSREIAFFGKSNLTMPESQNPERNAFEAYYSNGYKWWTGDTASNPKVTAVVTASISEDADEVQYVISTPSDSLYATLFVYRPDKYLWYGKMFSVEFRRSDNSVYAKYVPCYRKSDGEIGMYDVVSDTFFSNVGTGTFTKGADV